MKKKLLAALLALMLALSLAACGEDEAPGGGVGEIGSGNAPGGAEITDGGGADDLPGAAGEVTVEGEKVIYTTDDGLGNTSVTEYLYQDGALDEIVMTMHCADAAAAKTLYDSYTAGELKDYAAELYSEIHQDGKQVRMTFQESYLTTFSGFTMEQLASLLETGDPYAAGGAADGAGGSGEMTANTSWEALPLPEGFPKLAEGVTSYAQPADNITSLDWNVMTLKQAEAMLAPIEKWAGAKFEAYGDEAYMNWSLSTDTLTVTMAYFADPGPMSQVSLTISVW